MSHIADQTVNQQHPISIYLKVWALLFVLSTLSYLVDYFQLQGYTRPHIHDVKGRTYNQHIYALRLGTLCAQMHVIAATTCHRGADLADVH